MKAARTTAAPTTAAPTAAAPTVASPTVATRTGAARPASRIATQDAARRWRWTDWGRAASPLALLLLWQAASATGVLSPHSLASPLRILATGAHLLATGQLGNALLVSSLRVAIGFSIALTLGVALALLTGLSAGWEMILDPPLQMFKAMPFLGLLPLFILWFGIGELPKIILVAVGAIMPIYLTLHGGIRGVDSRQIEAGRALGLGAYGRVRNIILPGALPALLVGIRYGLSVAWLSLVVAEQINADSGLGALISNARDFLQTDVIVLCLLVYALLGLATDGAVRAIETRALHWRPTIRV